jgi:hypothetical protein
VTDQLTAVLDRFVSDQRPAVPPIADVRTRARQRRRRRRSSISAAAAVAVLLSGAGLWAIQATREPGILVVADGEVRLNDWVTLTWLPDDVDDVTSVEWYDSAFETQRVFGYAVENYRFLSTAGAEIGGIEILVGFRFSAEAELQVHPEGLDAEITRVGDTVVRDLRLPSTVGGTAVRFGVGDDVIVHIWGDDTGELLRIANGLRTGRPPSELPGAPVELAGGTDPRGVPWQVVVTRPDETDTTNLDPAGVCMVLRTYNQSTGCARFSPDAVTVSWFPAPSIATDRHTRLLLRGPDATVGFRYETVDGETGSVAASSAFPGSGTFAVLDATGEASEVVLARVEAVDAAGRVIAER